MALFGKVDQDLPILTRFYQVQPPGCSDLECFLKSEMYEFLNREWFKAQTANFAKMSGREKIPAMVGEVSSAPVMDGWLERYPVVHAVARRFMDAFADDTDVDAADVAELEKLLQEQEYRDGPRSKNIGSYKVTGFVAPWLRGKYDKAPGRSLYVTRGAGTIAPAVIPEITQELENLININSEMVFRCAECKNPFVATKNGQKYCSHRCGNRVSSRKAYQNKAL